MTTFKTLFCRQIKAYFCSPVAYVMIMVFLIVSGLCFCRMMLQSQQECMQIGDLLFGCNFFWLLVLVVIALLTMHLFAEEKLSGTLESLLTAPVTDTAVIMAKYFAALFFFILMCMPTVLYLIIVRAFDAIIGPVDVVSVITGYFGLFLIAASYIAFGLFVSSLTRSQMISAIVCFAGIALAFYCNQFVYIVRGMTSEGVLGYISGFSHVYDFSHGILDTQPLVFYLSAIIFFLFATVKTLELRNL